MAEDYAAATQALQMLEKVPDIGQAAGGGHRRPQDRASRRRRARWRTRSGAQGPIGWSRRSDKHPEATAARAERLASEKVAAEDYVAATQARSRC